MAGNPEIAVQAPGEAQNLDEALVVGNGVRKTPVVPPRGDLERGRSECGHRP